MTDKIPVALLTISIDPELIQPATHSAGDAYDRQLKYASLLTDYRAITYIKHAGADSAPVRVTDNFTVYPLHSKNLVWYVRDAIRLGSQVCRTHRIDAISTQDPFFTALIGYCLKKKFGLPLSIQSVADQVDNPFWLKERRVYPWLNRLAHWLIRHADTFRVNSAEQKDRLIRLGTPPDHVWNLPMMIDLEPFRQADGTWLRRELLRDQFDHLILFMGRLTAQKNLPLLLRSIPIVLAQQPRTLWVIVGDGDRSTELHQLVEQLNISEHVLFTGSVAYADTPAYFAASDLFILPSIYEGSARVLALAAAASKPIIATQVSGTSDIVLDGESGFIVPTDDSNQLADRTIQLLADPDRASRMGRAAQSQAGKVYDEGRILNGFRDLWQVTAQLKRSGT